MSFIEESPRLITISMPMLILAIAIQFIINGIAEAASKIFW